MREQTANDLKKKIGARPAGACTCERAATENKKPTDNACACGLRAASTSLRS